MKKSFSGVFRYFSGIFRVFSGILPICAVKVPNFGGFVFFFLHGDVRCEFSGGASWKCQWKCGNFQKYFQKNGSAHRKLHGKFLDFFFGKT